jgi:hypothetical protein
MKFLKQYRDYKIQESSKDNGVIFYLAYPQMERGYGGLGMIFMKIEGIDRIPVGDYSDLELFGDNLEDHDSDMYGKVYLMASKEEYPYIDGHPGYIPQQSDLDDFKDMGRIEYWAPIDDIDDIGAALGELYDTDYSLAVELFLQLDKSVMGREVLKYAEDFKILTQEELSDIKNGRSYKDFGLI